MTAPSPLGGLPLTQSTLDRAADRRRDRDWLDRSLADPRTRVLDLYGDRAPYDDDGAGPRLRYRAPAAGDGDTYLLGVDGTVAYFAAVHAPEEDGEDRRSTARALAPLLDDTDAGVFVTALGLANWHAAQGFCPACGAPTDVRDAGWVRRCTACDRSQWPRTDPAVIMAVVDADDRLLLARAPSWPPARMSVLAGFVEPGETFEAAVAREVAEEVGIAVTDIEYRASQPWPFPASIMVGFRARALTTDLSLDSEEIATARWITREELTRAYADGELALSPRLSISRHLLEEWYGGSPAGSAPPA